MAEMKATNQNAKYEKSLDVPKKQLLIPRNDRNQEKKTDSEKE